MAKIKRRTAKESVEKFLDETMDARDLSQRCRDYFDDKQWTEIEAAKLRGRGQAPIVVNRIKPKVKGLLGIYELRKTDPKAFPRTRKHEKSSQVCTDGLRYVADNTRFDQTRLDVAEDFFVEGYGGAIVDVRRKGESVEIQVKQIPWDRIYFDPHSRRKDFKDARYMGVLVWMDRQDVPDAFPDKRIKKELLEGNVTGYGNSQDDRPRWAATESDRVRIAMHFEKVKGVWKMSVFSGDYTIQKEIDSPYLDEDGLPVNPIELVSDMIDADNNRYSEVAGFLSQQDEINHRRSKFLHLNSTRQTYGNDNAIQDVAAAKKALARPNGHLHINGDAQFGQDFGVIPTGDFSNAQFNLYMDAKNEMDRSSFNAPLGGDAGGQELSGRAIDKLQQAGTLELNRQYSTLAAWERRIYEQIWLRIRQFWTEEKWIRVTDDQADLRWVGMNSQVTAAQMLKETAEDKSLPLEVQINAQKTLDFLIQTENPRLSEIVDVSNPIAELDMDIIVDQSFDVVNIQQEQFEMLAQFAQGSDMDIIELIELSQLRGKDTLIEKIQRRRQERMQAQAQEADPTDIQLDRMEKQAKIQKTGAEIGKIQSSIKVDSIDAIQKQIENANLINNPDPSPQVSV